MRLIQIRSHLHEQIGNRYSTRDGACRQTGSDDDWIKRRSARASVGRVDLAVDCFDAQWQIDVRRKGDCNPAAVRRCWQDDCRVDTAGLAALRVVFVDGRAFTILTSRCDAERRQRTVGEHESGEFPTGIVCKHWWLVRET
jgi:hypothetical protein